MQNYLNSLYFNWKSILSDNNIRYQLIIIAFSYFFLFKYCRILMTIFEARIGIQVMDPLLKLMPSYNCSEIIFTFTYTALATFILSTIAHPKTFIIALMGYCMLIILRTFSIYMVPLEPPLGMILLKDPVSNLFLNAPHGGYIVKDLFFSGHVSTIMLFFFVSDNKNVKRLLLLMAIPVSVFLLIQHVHYTIDILAAPFFAFLAFKGSLYLKNFVSHKKNPILDTVNEY